MCLMADDNRGDGRVVLGLSRPAMTEAPGGENGGGEGPVRAGTHPGTVTRLSREGEGLSVIVDLGLGVGLRAAAFADEDGAWKDPAAFSSVGHHRSELGVHIRRLQDRNMEVAFTHHLQKKDWYSYLADILSSLTSSDAHFCPSPLRQMLWSVAKNHSQRQRVRMGSQRAAHRLRRDRATEALRHPPEKGPSSQTFHDAKDWTRWQQAGPRQSHH
ncbi:hypothetical protein TREES_T100020504 [Tupaia chinensis]|uniref:Uncharacterized protein n=1 Tax=Tupaia chinensis TaxID=246437 RepID=L9KVR7_TUPCH|nr:hypothetical protein TREES_T100020504 [Tupaia chinensis]